MKKIYLLLIATAFVSSVSAQSISKTKTGLVTQSGYSSIIQLTNKIIWIFNDVGNVNTNRISGTNDPAMIQTTDQLHFSSGSENNSGMIIIYDPSGKKIVQKFSAGTSH